MINTWIAFLNDSDSTVTGTTGVNKDLYHMAGYCLELIATVTALENIGLIMIALQELEFDSLFT